MALTQDDKDMITYFLTEKGNVERWTGWEKVKPDVEKELPELMHALKQLEIAEKILQAVIESIN